LATASKTNMSALTRRMAKVLAPLSKREETAALRAATATLLADSARRASARYRLLSAELLIERPLTREALPKRRVTVRIADYGARQIMEYAVEKGKVITAHPAALQPTFAADEIAEARALAERDSRLTALIQNQRKLFVSAFSPEKTPKRAGRPIMLRYLSVTKGRPTAFLAMVVVDLFSNKVISVAHGGPGDSAGGHHG